MTRSAVFAAIAALGMIQGCVQTQPSPAAPVMMAPAAQPDILPVEMAARNFVAVVGQVEPVAERYCQTMRRVANCDFQIVIDDRPGQPPNAFQTLDQSGRPILAFTVALIRDARNREELAFVLGHEAAHHIAGHIPRQQNSAMAGAVLAGILAQVGGAG